jgi:uncharacterized protein (DUF2147 family)
MLRSSVLAFVTALLTGAGTASAADPAGLWQSETGLSRYQIRHCGQGICVRIVWIVEGPEVRDANNPERSKRQRRVMGIDIVSNSRRTAENRWSGSIYNFKNGKTYDGWAELDRPDRLRMAGCVFGGLICLTQILSRIE